MFYSGTNTEADILKLIQNLVHAKESVPLRSSANQMSYFDKQKYATDDALNIGRVHCMQEGWDDALVSFMQSGGFSPSSKVPLISAPTLILWGRQDKVS